MNDVVRAGARLGGMFDMTCWRRVPQGEEAQDDVLMFSKRRQKWEWRRKVWHEKFHNIYTNEGLDHILNVEFNAATQLTTWYCLIFETDTTPAAGTTYAVPVWTESTAYDEATRPAYVEAASTARSITNSANKAVFTISATKTIYGAALVAGGTAATTKGDAAGGGTLSVAGKFAASRAVVDDDVLNLSYTITAADDGI